LGGGLLDLTLPQGIDLLAPEVHRPVQDDALPQVVVFGIGSRSGYEHQGHRISLALGDHIGDEGGGEYHPLHLCRVHAGYKLVERSQQALQEVIVISRHISGLDHFIAVHNHGVGGGAANINSYQHFHSPFGVELGRGGISGLWSLYSQL